ncbi:MAG: protein-disulfide reductase DsbD family protein [Gemmataceae bacterium]
MKRRANLFFLAMLCLVFALPALAQPGKPGRKLEDVLYKKEVTFEPAEAKPGDIVTWKLSLEIAPNWHTYPTHQADPKASSLITKIEWPKNTPLLSQGSLMEPTNSKGKPDPALEIKEYRYLEGSVTFSQSFRVAEDAATGKLQFAPRITLTVCDDNGCLPVKVEPATLNILGGAKPALPGRADPKPPVAQIDNRPPEQSAEYRKTLESILGQLQKLNVHVNSGLAPFLLTAMLWGGISLLTPCVFPMIPITVSFFLKQSEKNHGNPVWLAFIYCSTIVVVLGTASLTLLSTFTKLSINPFMNLFIGGLFVALALSLFGMYDLTLPNFLTRFTSSREGRGGVVGTVFMALTFTVVSFTCVAPFLGGFGGMAASGQFSTFELVLGAFAFSATFAAPFFFLALFPSLIRRLPKSGGWLHTVKVVMGFVELAAALKFFRAAELVKFSEATVLTYDLVLVGWVVLSLLCGLYLLKLVRLGHHEEELGVGVPRFLFGAAFLALSIYLVPALFLGGPDGGNQRPRGTVFAWIDAFLLPDSGDARGSDIKWSGDLAKAITDARNERRLTGQPHYIFIDFTGETCPNCRFNERTVFSRGEIKQLLQKYRLIQLYTDKVPDQYYPADIRGRLDGVDRQRDDAEVNRWFQDKAFGSTTLPLYAILEPLPLGVTVTAVYPESKINDVTAFTEFLRKPLVPTTTVAER